MACGSPDPWIQAGLGDPQLVEARQWHAIELAGHRLGIEERVTGRNGSEPIQLRRRHYRFLVEGVATELRVGGLGTIDPVAIDGLDFPVLAGPEEVDEPVDLVGLLRRDSAPIPNARTSRRGIYRLGQKSIVVDRPLAAEIPAASMDLLKRLVARTRAQTDGDCKAHAAQLVVIAAERGLDARVVGGLVYVESSFGTGFHPHAWTEVYTGGRWLQVDAILDQPLADATHIPVIPRDVVSRSALVVVEVR